MEIAKNEIMRGHPADPDTLEMRGHPADPDHKRNCLEIDLNEVKLPTIQRTKLQNVGEPKPLSKREKVKFHQMLSKFEKDGAFKNLILPDFLIDEYPENFASLIEHRRILEESEFTREVTACKTDEERKEKIKQRLKKKLQNRKK